MSTTLRIAYQSVLTPPTIAEYDIATASMRTLKRVDTPNVDLDAYVAFREWAEADDGTLVPLDIVRRRDTPANATVAIIAELVRGGTGVWVGWAWTVGARVGVAFSPRCAATASSTR